MPTEDISTLDVNKVLAELEVPFSPDQVPLFEGSWSACATFVPVVQTADFGQFLRAISRNPSHVPGSTKRSNSATVLPPHPLTVGQPAHSARPTFDLILCAESRRP